MAKTRKKRCFKEECKDRVIFKLQTSEDETLYSCKNHLADNILNLLDIGVQAVIVFDIDV